jgi:hypothetical protein
MLDFALGLIIFSISAGVYYPIYIEDDDEFIFLIFIITITLSNDT